ncbi:Multidrug transporter EmrE [compost metagenome]
MQKALFSFCYFNNIPTDWYVIVEFLMNPILMAYALLAMAIISEVIGSTFLVKSEGFTKLLPSLAVVVLFSLAFYLLSQVIKVIPLGIAYAIWAGVGIVLTALIGYFVFRQSLDFAAMIGIALIVSGVVVINLFSNSTGH